jgi:hypothetical protein
MQREHKQMIKITNKETDEAMTFPRLLHKVPAGLRRIVLVKFKQYILNY